jgi:hypothetical protein
MTTSRQGSRRSARSASGRASRRCRGSRSSSPRLLTGPLTGWCTTPGVRRHRRAQRGSPMLRSIRPTRATTSRLRTRRPAKPRLKLRQIVDHDSRKGGSERSELALLRSDRGKETRVLRYPLDSQSRLARTGPRTITFS